MPPLGGSFLTNPLFQVISFGAGTAMGPVLRPLIQDIQNETWQTHPVRPLDLREAALAAIKGVPSTLNFMDEALKSGYGGEVFGVLEQNLRRYPDTGELLELWRRDRLSIDEVNLALQRAGIPEPFRAAVLDLFTSRLDPAIIATAIQRGIIADPGFLPVGPPSAGGKVQRFPVSSLGALTEAKAQGIDEARLFVETALVGLPASNEQAANAYFRGIIELSDYYAAISEGNTRNEWRDAILEQSRQILTSNQYTELELRGYIDAATRRTLTAKHGMSPADSDRLLQVLGRSITPHQVVTALARGGKYPGDYANVPQPYKASIQRSNIREEYSELAYANRYTYPSFFAIRGLLTGGVFTADEGYQILLEMGWKPELARKVADFYGVATTVADGPLTKSARTQAVTEIRNAFLIGQADEGQARGWLGAIGVTALEQDGMLPIWRVMLEVPQRGLTVAQIVKAYKNLPAQWPRPRALDELQMLGLTADDAATLLDE